MSDLRQSRVYVTPCEIAIGFMSCILSIRLDTGVISPWKNKIADSFASAVKCKRVSKNEQLIRQKKNELQPTP